MALPMKSAACPTLVTEKRSFVNGSSKHMDYITDHYFNYNINLVLPGLKQVPTEILSTLSEQHFCLVKNIPLSDLIRQDFIEAFVKKGQIYMLSQGTCVDTEDCIALLPTGDLKLNLTRETFVELGLEGRPSKYHKKNQNKYVVTIPLTASYFHGGKKYHSRVEWCLNKQPDLHFNLLVAWEPNDTEVSSYSIEHYFKDILGHETHQCELLASRRVLGPTKIPLAYGDSAGQQWDSSEFYEWLGAVTCNIDCDGAADDYVNSYCPPEPMINTKHCVCCTFKGFFTPESIISVLQILQAKLTKSESNTPWLALTVHGFQDSIMAWKNQEHGFSVSGDNFYTFVLLPDDKYFYYRALGEHDVGC